MDEVIEAILNDAVEKSEDFSFTDQAFIFSELSERFSGLSHDALMAEGRTEGGIGKPVHRW